MRYVFLCVIRLSSDTDIAIVDIYFSFVMTTLKEIGMVMDMAKLMYGEVHGEVHTHVLYLNNEQSESLPSNVLSFSLSGSCSFCLYQLMSSLRVQTRSDISPQIRSTSIAYHMRHNKQSNYNSVLFCIYA